MDNNQDQIRQTVRQGYAEIAKKNSCCCGTQKSSEELAKGIGYLAEELAAIPEGSNMGLSCGNPTAVAQLKPGQVVLDLGSGGGFDVFVAAKKVGAAGKAIGVDMTPEMLLKSRNAIAVFTKKTGLDNVEFRLGEIEHLPVADNSIDVVISNCVINLSPDKPQVWREIYRVLKPCGKACVSDLAVTEKLPDRLKDCVSALVGCVAGAVTLDETKTLIESAGLTELQISIEKYNFDIMENCSDSFYKTLNENMPAGKKLSDYVISANFTAKKIICKKEEANVADK